MWQERAAKNTKVFVYGPLDESIVITSPNPNVAPPNPVARPLESNAGPAGVSAAQGVLTRGGARVLPTFSKAELVPDVCCPSCDDFPHASRPACGPQPHEPPMLARGHFIAHVPQ